MTMTAAGTNAQIAPPGALRVALIVIAAIATLGAIADFPIAFHDFGHTEPLLVFAQRVTSAKLMIAPLIAGTALVFAATGRTRAAIATLAALMLVNWASDLPTFPIHGLELSLGTTGAITLVERFVFPLLRRRGDRVRAAQHASRPRRRDRHAADDPHRDRRHPVRRRHHDPRILAMSAPLLR